MSVKDTRQAAGERLSEITQEFTRGFGFLEDYPQAVSFFGSRQVKEGDKHYEDARALAARIVSELHFPIITGGGPGIMEAANRGAREAGGESIGLNIELPGGQSTNTYITESMTFYYFFVRKVCLAFSAEAFIFYPGGFGTFDEFFEVLTLIQTRKVVDIPLICVGTEFWSKLYDFAKTQLLPGGFIDLVDLELFTITDDHDRVIDLIKNSPMQASATVPLEAPVSL